MRTTPTATAPMRPLSFGIKTSQIGIGYEEILSTWRDADRIPLFEHAWLWDQMVPRRGDASLAALEAWTLLAALAAQTTRLRFGVMVTDNRLRFPTLLAKMAATVDIISGGRLIFGIGVGGSLPRSVDPAELALVRREFDAYGVELVPTPEAIAALGEALTITRRLWTETEPFDFEGRCYRLRGAIGEPKPVQRPGPPILIGAYGERLSLRVVAEHADIWNCPAPAADEFARRSAILDQHCAAVGRDPREIVRSVQLFVARDDAAQARERILSFAAAGATHLVLAALPTPPSDAPAAPAAEWLATEIIEPVIAQTA
ncbi:MAG: LLM class flavin-dependent oxidoreductase [Candidatus Dormibacteria bacterium]|jgi:alkanesulfonate monooxygenase SsuD/methylene tetrahydromethanopterin reductase-like flavin-dependent oxidoreductase (luciferase family)